MQICTTSKKNKSPPVPIQSHQLNFIKIYGFGGGPGDPPVKEKSEPMHVPRKTATIPYLRTPPQLANIYWITCIRI